MVENFEQQKLPAEEKYLREKELNQRKATEEQREKNQQEDEERAPVRTLGKLDELQAEAMLELEEYDARQR